MTGLRKFSSLPPSDQRLLIRAALLLIPIRIGMTMLSFKSIRRLLARAAQAPELVAELERRLALYRRRQPYLESQ